MLVDRTQQPSEVEPRVQYEKIDDEGLHVSDRDGYRVLAVDNVVVCAGQEPVRDLRERSPPRAYPCT